MGNSQTKVYPKTFYKHTFWHTTPIPPPEAKQHNFRGPLILWAYTHNSEIPPQVGSVDKSTPTMYRLQVQQIQYVSTCLFLNAECGFLFFIFRPKYQKSKEPCGVHILNTY